MYTKPFRIRRNPMPAPAENQTQRGTIMLTPTEKADAKWLAKVRGCTESDLYRAMTPDEITAEAERVRRIKDVA